MYIESKCGIEKMEVLLTNGEYDFSKLIEEYMGSDARRYFAGLFEACRLREYNNGYDDGYIDGHRDGVNDA